MNLSETVNIRKHSQTIVYSPELEKIGVLGNCLQTAVASALGLEMDAVPHFGAFAWWEPAMRLWLRGRGMDTEEVKGIPEGRSIVIGDSPRLTGRHAVVGEAGQIVHDPHPSRAGLTKVRYSYLLQEWPGPPPCPISACVACGKRSVTSC